MCSNHIIAVLCESVVGFFSVLVLGVDGWNMLVYLCGFWVLQLEDYPSRPKLWLHEGAQMKGI